MNILALGLAVAGIGMTPTASAQEAPLRHLVDRFETARSRFDPAALADTLAPDYEEISPIGDVDSRAQVLGFYAPTAKAPVPPITTDDVVVRAQGPVALVTARRSITFPNGTTRAVRARYVARRDRGQWRLISTQYTPIPPAKTP
ncbi:MULTISPECIES: nuclear transport factor 2 family protein [unclassified Sphingomonas]|uniref:nuclear transport factor 2 family protein n=1 Tax=unclassified Sphingomonas TaxID=196159 RepID=UPI0028614CA3|nr:MULTISPECIES: nuclear transport factor 2 family protein [unclassified Sphingomonas]MDR6113763.1 uncharacterized protein (TIGR02246 family) [Sphingomonas sp. SORGH_AS_0789]MDR6148877.1 uncharacterized protein (TIGR02246 family) [Sphingomonas sp. SORGH_AS_0742]